ncbi:MAG: exodeoxyribonuclease VII large subunit [Nitrospinae bacterium]|nr:exodeoxyribonuclease VII large subunit [Nitrospinota bacterium]
MGDLLDNPEKVFGVSELSGIVKELLEEAFPSIWVEGEVSKALDHPSGHLYLTLKENKDVLDATMWRSSRKNLKFKIETGMKILLKGRMSSYGPYGKYQLIAERIEPSGVGALQIKFEQLKKKLAAKGYFDENRKRPIPEYPETIGLVTSESGAAFRDMARILRRRNRTVKIILAPVLVEGEQAAGQIARAIADFNEYGKVDVIIAGRGGGSPESLWAFNEEAVADAIFNSKIPVISAVGHEIDFTIADFVSDLRASTPSAAAELAVKNRADLIYTVALLAKRGTSAVSSAIREQRQRLAGIVRRPLFTDPARFLEGGRRRLDDSLSQILAAVKSQAERRRTNLDALVRHLRYLRPSLTIRRRADHVKNLDERLVRRLYAILSEKKRALAGWSGPLNALSPMRVLERGYAIARTPSGGVVKDSSRVAVGDELELLLHKGRLGVVVNKKL